MAIIHKHNEFIKASEETGLPSFITCEGLIDWSIIQCNHNIDSSTMQENFSDIEKPLYFIIYLKGVYFRYPMITST